MTSTSDHGLPYGACPPSNWRVIPLKHLATLTNGFVFKSDNWQETGTPIIRIENLNGSPNFNLVSLTLDKRYHASAGDLLFAWSGNPGTSFGPFRWKMPGQYFLNQHIFKVVTHGCEKSWLYWTLKAATYWIEQELTSGTIGMVHVTKEELQNVPIPIPPPDEQRRIADFLDAETSRIGLMQAKQRAVLEKLDQRDRAMRDQVLNEASHGVGEVPLRRWITRIEQGASPQCEVTPRDGDEWGVLKLSAVKGGIFDGSENKRLPEGVRARQEYEVQPGDLLVTRANTPSLVGDVAVVTSPARRLLLPDLIYRIGLIGEVDAHFVAQVALSSRVRLLIEAAARGSSQSMVKLRGEDIKSWLVPAANLDHQKRITQEIALGLRSTGLLKESVQRSLALLTERRQALITAAVTGQIDVSTASGRGIED